jgi:hypothetical protein
MSMHKNISRWKCIGEKHNPIWIAIVACNVFFFFLPFNSFCFLDYFLISSLDIKLIQGRA